MPAIAGAAILKAIPHSSAHKVPLLIGYYIVSVYPGISPLIYSWSAQNTAGDTKRKCTTAILFIGQSVGNVIGPQLYTTAEAPEYSRGLQSNLALFVVVAALSLITMAYVVFLNRSHSKRRVAAGKSAIVIDVSLHTAEEADRIMREREHDENAAAPTGDNAFEDMTDLETTSSSSSCRMCLFSLFFYSLCSESVCICTYRNMIMMSYFSSCSCT